jgi:hypothetical protein
VVTSLNGLPSVKGGDFTLNNLSKQPERREEILNGKPFLKFVWHSVLAAVKPGDFTLTVDTPLTVKINTRPSEDAAFANLLGGPFLQNFYSGIKPTEITITSQPSELHVLPLPTSGRPADFSGAVGTFKVSSDVSASHMPAGDPVTLRLHVSGAGNFDRVDSQMLERNDQWKTYPPKSSFSSTDTIGAIRQSDHSPTIVQLFRSRNPALRACPNRAHRRHDRCRTRRGFTPSACGCNARGSSGEPRG